MKSTQKGTIIIHNTGVRFICDLGAIQSSDPEYWWSLRPSIAKSLSKACCPLDIMMKRTFESVSHIHCYTLNFETNHDV